MANTTQITVATQPALLNINATA
ncbi:hypothetical protein CCACVL1_03803 [Corchorus capsularis]|uniref:Uncharacterized protein n=1 Tax=Corchorus capsularis TaxID=210143 RepID=A0A1R3JX69_COCAP|nr:hypothetical protein CCACVL1_03803 [Corchorus capsularis]